MSGGIVAFVIVAAQAEEKGETLPLWFATTVFGGRWASSGGTSGRKDVDSVCIGD